MAHRTIKIAGIELSVGFLDGGSGISDQIVLHKEDTIQDSGDFIVKYNDVDSLDSEYFSKEEFKKINEKLVNLVGISHEWDDEDDPFECYITFKNMEDIMMAYLELANSSLNL